MTTATAPAITEDELHNYRGSHDREDGSWFEVWRHFERRGEFYWTELDKSGEHYGPDYGPFSSPRAAYDDGRVQGYRRED